MFKFKELIKTGMASASEVEQNRKSINEVFSALNNALKEQTKESITIQKFIIKPGVLFDMANMARAYAMAKGELVEPTISIEKSAGKGTLDISLNDSTHEPIARWEQHPDGYPFTIEFLGERTDCWDQESLANTLGKIVASGQFWLKVKELESKQAENVKPPEDSRPPQNAQNTPDTK
ncbi:hypothetical protein ABRZ24_18925 [Brenneria populi]|uniref:Uncharacterized protein n=1 Tax=Brenneria populi TaxID=1505588 RepID=A0ABU6JV77_9GAMM|nr:hypothetical protein [Brenneria populi Li et al. 2015]